jgi:outer membrane lipoprotein SlyB
MRPLRFSAILLSVVRLLLTAGCYATTATSQTTWAAGAPPPAEWARPGYVEWVREVVRRQQGNPAGGAAAGAIIGAIVGGGRGPGALIGAAGGAAVGAAASQGTAERRTYEVAVRFDDGAGQVFLFEGYSPFAPGEAVALTPRGLARR